MTREIIKDANICWKDNGWEYGYYALNDECDWWFWIGDTKEECLNNGYLVD